MALFKKRQSKDKFKVVNMEKPLSEEDPILKIIEEQIPMVEQEVIQQEVIEREVVQEKVTPKKVEKVVEKQIEEKPIEKEVEQPKMKFIIVDKIPSQDIREVKLKDGSIGRYITESEALVYLVEGMNYLLDKVDKE